MSKSTQVSFLIAAAAIGIGLSLTGSAQAKSVSMLDKCQNSTKAVAEGCCSTWMKRNGHLVWVSEMSSVCRAPILLSSNSRNNPPPPPPPTSRPLTNNIK